MLNASSTQGEKCSHYRKVLKAYVDGINSGDVDGLCALFSDSAVVDDPYGNQPVRAQGAQAIRTFYESVAARKVQMALTGPITGSQSNAAAMPIAISVLGAKLNCISVAHFNDQGLIMRYMAHWGPGDYDDSGGDPRLRKPE